MSKSGLAVRWIPAIVIMATIFLASSIPASQLPNAGSWDILLKKGGHFLGYALLALGFLRAQTRQDRIHFIVALVGCGLYSLSDEFHQSFTTGRHPSLVDVGIDLVGALVGLILYARVRWIRHLTRMYLPK